MTAQIWQRDHGGRGGKGDYLHPEDKGELPRASKQHLSWALGNEKDFFFDGKNGTLWSIKMGREPKKGARIALGGGKQIWRERTLEW